MGTGVRELKISEKPLPSQVGATVGLGFRVTLLAKLVALLVRHDHQADADAHGREDEHEDDPAFIMQGQAAK
jgi:hypothetical protein